MSILLTSCNYTVNKSPSFGGSAVNNKALGPAGSPDFATIESMVFSQHCTHCHNANNATQDLSSYAGVLNFKSKTTGASVLSPGQAASSSPLFNSLQQNGGEMPLTGAPLNSSEEALLKEWIDDGAHEFVVGDSPTPPSSPTPVPSATPTTTPTPQPVANPGTPDFATIESMVFRPYCIGCHNPTRRPTQDLTTYAGLTAFVTNDTPPVHAISAGDTPSTSVLFQSLQQNGGDMPARGPALSPDLVWLLQQWVEAGAPENVPPPPPTPTPGPQPPVAASPTPIPTPIPSPSASPSPSQAAGAVDDGVPAPLLSYATDVKPILDSKCTVCHNENRAANNILLDSYTGLVTDHTVDDQGKSVDVPAPVVIGQSAKSPIITETLEDDMPPKGAVANGKATDLTSQEKALLSAWIDGGARP